MQEPANTPVDVILQEDAMKHESIVFQFHNICQTAHVNSVGPRLRQFKEG